LYYLFLYNIDKHFFLFFKLTFSYFNNIKGVAIFAFAAHAEILFIEQSIKVPEVKRDFNVTLTYVFGSVVLLYIVFGSLCYIGFNQNTTDIIFEAMAPNDILTKIVKVCVSLSLLFQYPITMFPAFIILEPHLFKGDGMFLRRALRTLICISTAAVAVALPDFTKIMAFVGALSTGIIVFILPSLLHLNVFQGELTCMQRCIDFFIITFGTISSVFASVMIGYSFSQ
jgi:proton-coupled amino acid transporter